MHWAESQIPFLTLIAPTSYQPNHTLGCHNCHRKKPDPPAILKDRKDIFDLFDQDRNGKVTKSEIITTFTELNLDICDEYANLLIQEFDRNGDGQLEFSEFVNLVKKYMKSKNYPTEGMFNYFDIDGDGYITTEEFIKSMRCLGVDITNESAVDMLEDFYLPGSEKIGYESFNEMIRRIF